jgi:hypothetical protein
MTSPVPHLSHKSVPREPYFRLTTPIPTSGTTGSLRVLSARAVKKGEKVTVVSSAGVFYEYFATTDVQITDSTTPGHVDIPVLPAMQATHVSFNKVYLAGSADTIRRGYSVIGDVAPFSAYGKPDGESNLALGLLACVPHLRPWPWATDIHGIPYDQANLLALSLWQVQSSFVATKEKNNIWNYSTSPPTLTSSNIDYGAYARTDEERRLVPVPKSIPSDYTLLTARNVFGRNSGYYSMGNGNNYALPQKFSLYRTATDEKNRASTLAPTRRDWIPASHEQICPSPGTSSSHDIGGGYAIFAGEDPVTKVMANWTPYFAQRSLTGLQTTYGPGARGGTYTLSAIGLRGPGSTACTIEIWMEIPGSADVMLSTHSFPARGALDPYTIREGVWTNLQAPAAPGTCCRVYAKGYSADPIIISGVSACTIMPSTQVPFVHGITTGNLVAPGGLIAPFY